MSDDLDLDQLKAFYLSLPEFKPFSVEPKDEDIELLKGCAEMTQDAGSNLFKATSVLTEAILIAGRSVRDREGRKTSFRYGSECRLAENEVSTEASIAWQIARMLLRSGLVETGKTDG